MKSRTSTATIESDLTPPEFSEQEPQQVKSSWPLPQRTHSPGNSAAAQALSIDKCSACAEAPCTGATQQTQTFDPEEDFDCDCTGQDRASQLDAEEPVLSCQKRVDAVCLATIPDPEAVEEAAARSQSQGLVADASQQISILHDFDSDDEFDGARNSQIEGCQTEGCRSQPWTVSPTAYPQQHSKSDRLSPCQKPEAPASEPGNESEKGIGEATIPTSAAPDFAETLEYDINEDFESQPQGAAPNGVRTATVDLNNDRTLAADAELDDFLDNQVRFKLGLISRRDE